MSLKGKYALITGSSRGIGRGIALKLAEQGVKVAINYCRNEAAANDALSKVRGLGSDGVIVQGDVCRPDDIGRMFSRAKQEFGALETFFEILETYYNNVIMMLKAFPIFFLLRH
jgi:NAD(P)-dependent dehydrogenase (short-subunit alcohol dehydrogenase family)